MLNHEDFNARGAACLPGHLGKTTQVWDAVVSHRESGKTIAIFRCTRMILYAKASA